MVKVPLGHVQFDLAQETVPAKSVVVPHGQNESLCPQVLHVNPILGTQGPLSWFGSRAGEMNLRERILTLRISLKVGVNVFFFTDVFLFPRLDLSGTR